MSVPLSEVGNAVKLCRKTDKFKIILHMIAVCLFFLITAVATEMAMTVDYNGLFGAIGCSQTEHGYYELSELNTLNCDIDGRRICSVSDDPQICIDNINDYVDSIQICLDDMSVSAIDVSVYYSVDGTYSEEQCISGKFPKNKGCILLNLGREVSSLRVDLGCAKNISYSFKGIVLNPHAGKFILNSFRNLSWIRIIIYFWIIAILYCSCRNWNITKRLIFKYRWALGLVLFIFCTALKLHGSSIGVLSTRLSGMDVSGLWGTPRTIRSDEWVAFTEMALAQVNSGFKWFSQIWGYSPSDMFLIYGQPVLNLVTIFRPFSLGYIFMGAEYGLSFYWNSRLILLILVSFEFGRLLTNDDRKLSAAYSFLIAFSPLVQWWYSINGLVEMLIFGQAFILLMKYFLETDHIKGKVLAVCGLVICAGGFVMTFYPAWMVPFAYAFVTCLIAWLIDNRKHIKISKTDILLLTAGMIVLAGCLIYVFSRSWDTFKLIMNTEYPGSRRYTGGPLKNIVELFRGWTSFLWGFTDCENPCERVCFISFFPMGIIISLHLFIKEKVKDVWLTAINLCNIFLILYLIFPFPEGIARETLLGFSSERMVNVIGFLNVLLLIRGLSFYKKEIKTHIIVVFGFIIAGISYAEAGEELNPGSKLFVLLFVVISVILITKYTHSRMKNVFCSLVIIVSVIGGLSVNPTESGLANIYDDYLVQCIADINKENPGTWFVNGYWDYENLPAIAGADCVSSLQTYPDTDMWNILGLDSKKNVWNRYAHINGTIENVTDVELVYDDQVHLSITVEDLERLGVKYIFSISEIDDSDDFELLESYDGFYIYEMKR